MDAVREFVEKINTARGKPSPVNTGDPVADFINGENRARMSPAQQARADAVSRDVEHAADTPAAQFVATTNALRKTDGQRRLEQAMREAEGDTVSQFIARENAKRARVE